MITAASQFTRDRLVVGLHGRVAEWRRRVGAWRVRFAFRFDTRTVEVLRVLRVLPRERAYRNQWSAHMRYSVLLLPEPEEGGFSVLVPALPGCLTQGETVNEALANAREAIALHGRALRRHGDAVPEEVAAPQLACVDVAV